jgi:hypothetical protein
MSVTAASALLRALAQLWPPILANRGPTAAAADVSLDQGDPRRGDINDRAAVKLDRQVFLLLAVFVDVAQTTIQPDAVRQVDDQIARFQLCDRVDRFATRPRPSRRIGLR